MAPGLVRNYVLQDDPVPRALLSADPALLALTRHPAVEGLLRLRRQWLSGEAGGDRGSSYGDAPSLSPSRFLFHPAGEVRLVRWSAAGGHRVHQLSAGTLARELRLDVEALRSNPVRPAG